MPRHRVVAAEWCSDEARWTVEVERSDTGETFRLSCGFLFTCTGYYRYDEGYTPEFTGIERFGGEVVHPQFWTDDIDYSGKRVVVIGSGATAITLLLYASTAADQAVTGKAVTGAILLAAVLFLPDGILGRWGTRRKRSDPAPAPSPNRLRP